MATLYIISTPIGNLDDISLRALKTLFQVPIIAAEDTRHTGNLLEVFRRQPDLLKSLLPNLNPSTRPKFVSFHEHNEQMRLSELLNYLIQGQDIALVSDAGTPLISDPGYKLVKSALTSSVKVVAVPGASALLTALVASDQPPSSHLYLGYLPTKQNARRKFLLDLQTKVPLLPKKPTIIVYESPHRLVSMLNDFQSVFGSDHPLTLAQELTKLHEKITTSPVSLHLQSFAKSKPRGEFVVLFNV